MIHTSKAPQRRIAIVQLPRAQAARLGSIRAGMVTRQSAAAGWATISDAEPDTSANWLASVLLQQQQARTTTPGTLTYTPASNTPAPNVAWWNNWLQPNCDPSTGAPPAADPTDAAAPADKMKSVFWSAIGVLVGAASLSYLAKGNR